MIARIAGHSLLPRARRVPGIAVFCMRREGFASSWGMNSGSTLALGLEYRQKEAAIGSSAQVDWCESASPVEASSQRAQGKDVGVRLSASTAR